MIREELVREWSTMGFMQRLAQTSKVLRFLYKTADDVLGSTLALQEQQLRKPTSCTGCRTAGCCRHVVYVSALEALWVTRGLQLTEWDSQEGVRKILEIGEAQRATPLKEWMSLDRPCPFLDTAGLCTVYDYRPIACRMHYVWCPPDRCGPKRVVVEGPAPAMPVTEMLLGVVPVLHKLQALWGWGPAVAPLPYAVGIIGDAINKGADENLTSSILGAKMRPADVHGVALPVLWPGVDLKAVKRAARRKR